MCGINGILSTDSEIKRKIITQNKLLSHRGPDDEGFTAINTSNNEYISFAGDDSIQYYKHKLENIQNADFSSFDLFLGHRRLSIIDLSEKGHAPMSDSTNKIWITYNGEIYNYIELRDELLSCGYKFRSSTDTEVIIYAYLKWGLECVNHFNGMWAFGLWDGIKKRLFLSRDRFGVKPLYYSYSNNYFAFSSELKPLAYLIGNKVEINELSIGQFFINGNRFNTESTYLKNIFSLPPSHYLIYKEGPAAPVKYYDIADNKTDVPDEKLISEMDRLLTDAIKLRFRSDVTVGTCLSGGFDSSSIVAFSNKFLTRPLETFSAVWEDKRCDESKYIDLINSKYNCKEHKIIPREDEFESIFKKIHYFQEIPTEGPGLYPQWHVMQSAKNNVKVLLNGQGGDEVFGGYFMDQTYLYSLLKDKSYLKVFKNLNKYYSFLRQNSIHDFTSWMFPQIYREYIVKNRSVHYNIFKDEFIRKHKMRKFKNAFKPQKKFRNHINNQSYHFITDQTIPSLLHYEDRASMAHSIESRVPFLDYRLVEFGLNLKPKYLIHNGVSRPLFRTVVEKYLPKEIIDRTDKLGYPTPFSDWIKTGLKDYVSCVLENNNSNLYEYLNKNVVIDNILKKHMSGEVNYGWEIWRLLSLDEFIHLFKSQNYLSFSN